MTLRILADHDVEGHVQVLLRLCASAEWAEIWESLACHADSFEGLGLSHETTDIKVWQLCQEREIVLVTGNRNADGPTSLEIAIRQLGAEKSLPVITISDSKRLLRDRDYAQAAAAQLLQDLVDLESLRGTGRLYIP